MGQAGANKNENNVFMPSVQFLTFSFMCAKQKMALREHIGESLRQRVVDMVTLSGMSYRDVCSSLAKDGVWVPRSTVGRIILRWKKFGNLARSKGSGRPRKTTPRIDRRLCSLARKHPRLTRKALKELLLLLAFTLLGNANECPVQPALLGW